MTQDPGSIYDAYYYQTGCGAPYERTENWLKFFDLIAERIISDLNPKTVLDVGCAWGFLVEALRNRGVEAYGVDVSEYAIQNVHPSIRPYCWVGSAADPFPQKYDLIVTIEVLEHMPKEVADQAIANLCRFSEGVLFSSGAQDFEEITHLNLQPIEYWASQFARHGYFRDVDFDATFLTPWSIYFRPKQEPIHRLIMDYERRIDRLIQENHAVRQTNLSQKNILAEHDKIIKVKDEMIAQKDQLVLSLFSQVNAVQNSRTFRLMRKLRSLAPVGSRREKILLKGWRGAAIVRRKGVLELLKKENWLEPVVAAAPSLSEYEQWIADFEPGETALKGQAQREKEFSYRPLISVITPVYNPDPQVLEQTIASVLAQTYTNWEMCLVNGDPSNQAVCDLLSRFSASDSRVRVKVMENRGISGNSNACLEMAQGEFVALLDHDDTLAPFALFEMVRFLNETPDFDLLYSDHDILDALTGKRKDPLFKPGWSPDIMLSSSYITHLTVIRKSLVDQVGGFDSDKDGAQDWDLFFRVVEQSARVARVPGVLYHWRDSATSTATNIYAKSYAPKAQHRAIEGHLSRIGRKSAKAFIDETGFLRATWDFQPEKVTILIPTPGANAMLETCVNSILSKTQYSNYEVLILNNGPRKPEAFDYYKSVSRDPRVRVLHYEGDFNYSSVNNFGVRNSDSPYLLFLNNDTEILYGDWLQEMVMWASCPEIGAVGAKLISPNGAIQHAGVVLGLTGFAGHLFGGRPQGAWSIFGPAEWYRNFLAVTAACMMVRREVYEKLGGLKEEFALCGNDVEFGMRLNQAGYRVIYNPFVRVRHLESATHRGSIPAQDFFLSFDYYQPVLKSGDPYFNPNLSNWSLSPQLRKVTDQDPYQFAAAHIASLKRG